MAVEVSTGGSSASEAISPTNGSVNVAVLGPDHSLHFYWNVAGRWYGPLGIGAANSAFSAPAIVAESDGNFDIAVEGRRGIQEVQVDAGNGKVLSSKHESPKAEAREQAKDKARTPGPK
jgi:hypothetical protein